jgi:hypothetical protein
MGCSTTLIDFVADSPDQKQGDAQIDSATYLSADEWKSLHGLLQKYAKDSQPSI